MHKFLAGACLLVLMATLALGQNATGSIGGVVTDPAGARVPAATVTATNVETNIIHQTASTDTGDYQILQLAPGTYNLSVEAKGFKTAQHRAIKVQVADRLTMNVTMEVGQVTETVQVTAEPPLLRTEDAQMGQVIDSLMLENLPQIDRQPLNLMRLSGNVSGDPMGNTSGGPYGGNSASDVRVNGGRTSGVEYLVDGASIMAGKNHSATDTAVPAMETVDEFKIISNGISAEYGRASGGVVELATKGGTNQLHGQAFEYFWNDRLNANSFTNNQNGAPRGYFHKNTYGFMVGGPAYVPKVYNGKNKTFFLFDWSQVKHRFGGQSHLGLAPTGAERNGDMSGTLYAGASPLMYDPLGVIRKDDNGNLVKVTLLGGDGLHVPQDRIDPGSAKVISLLAPPNRTPTPGYSQRNAFMGAQSQSVNVDDWSVRLDHNFTDKQHVNLRFKRENFSNLNSQWYNDMDPANGDTGNGTLNGSLAWDYTITPTTIFTLRFSMMHNPDNHKKDFKTSMQGWQFDPQMLQMQRYLPGVNWHLWSANQMGWGDMLGGANVIPSDDNYSNGSIVASIAKIYHKHTIKAGFDTRRYYDNHYEDFPATINYYQAAVAQQNYGDPTWSSGNTGFANSWGSFLLGIPDSASKTLLYTMANASNYYASYLQDDIKVSSRLTVNAGVRWEVETPLSERHNKIYGWDPNAPSAWNINSGWSWDSALAGAGLTADQIASLPKPAWAVAGKFPSGAPFFAGTPEHPGRLMTGYNFKHFAPRLGVAYQLDSKTVIRSGFSMMYLTRNGNYWSGWVSGADSVSSSVYDRDPVTGNIAHSNMSFWSPNEYVKYVPSTTQLARTLAGMYATGANMIDMTQDTPHEFDWHFSIQRQLPWSTLLELAYNGNHSGNLLANNFNAVFPASLIQPKYYSLFSTMVANPAKGQVQNTGLTTGDTIPLGQLMLSNPMYGGIGYNGANIGINNYNALNVKVEKRLSKGITMLFNYTFSKSLDNVGGVDQMGYKSFQSWQTINDVYGYSPFDETHRVTFYHDVQLPVGKGRKFLHSPNSAGEKLLDGVLGGWEYAGILVVRSGRPVTFPTQPGNTFQNAGVGSLWGQQVGNPINSSFQSDHSALLGPNDDPSKVGVPRFLASSFQITQQNASSFVVSNILPVYGNIRNPGNINYDASLIKNFPMFREGMRLQFRAEAQNVLNIRGYGSYDTTVGDAFFGFITGAGNTERRMQVSARFFF